MALVEVFLALASTQPARAALTKAVAGHRQGAHHATHCPRGPAPRALVEDSCFLPDTQDDEVGFKEAPGRSKLFDLVLTTLPIVVPLLAFNGYDEVLSFISWAIDSGPGNWLAVDGGKEQVTLLQPSINGVILPAISIALGTLSATTISSLRDRQISLRECLHRPAKLRCFFPDQGQR